MTDRARRRELTEEYRQNPPEAGVYQLVNTVTGKVFLGTALNLPSVRGKLEFSQRTGTVSALDRKLRVDLTEYGAAAFTFEVLEVLDVLPNATPASTRDDLAALEALWREKLDPARLY
jgi:hypothetical protein